jgi:hypothetical protein
MVIWGFIAIILGDLAREDPKGTKAILLVVALMMVIVCTVMMGRWWRAHSLRPPGS